MIKIMIMSITVAILIKSIESYIELERQIKKSKELLNDLEKQCEEAYEYYKIKQEENQSNENN